MKLTFRYRQVMHIFCLTRTFPRVVAISLTWIAFCVVFSLNYACGTSDDAFIKDLQEYEEQNKAEELPGVYEVRGLLTNEERLYTHSAGAVYSPKLILYVDEVVRREGVVQSDTPPTTDPDSYLILIWSQIDEGWRSPYEGGGIEEPLPSFVDKKVRIAGIIYDQCGYGWYLRDQEDSEVSCGFSMLFSQFPPDHIELRDRGGGKWAPKHHREIFPQIRKGKCRTVAVIENGYLARRDHCCVRPLSKSSRLFGKGASQLTKYFGNEKFTQVTFHSHLFFH